MRVVIADDAAILREGLTLLLGEAGFVVAGAAADADALLALVEAERPDVAIVDIRMPPGHGDDGLRAARVIRERWPQTGVLVLSQHVRPGYAVELLAGGAAGVGYLLKERVSDVGELAAAVRAVAAGGSILDPAVVEQLVGRRAQGPDRLTSLSERERDVLAQMAAGRSNRAIGQQLHITEHTVEKHVSSIFGKLGIPPSPDDHRRVLAVLAYLDGR